MEKKTAIVVINNTQFATDSILAKDNGQRINWFSRLVDDNSTINDPELVSVYDTVEAYCREYNAGCLRSEVFDLVTIEYTDKVDGKFVNQQYPVYEISMRLCVRIISHNQNDTDLRNIATFIRKRSKKMFGDAQCLISGYWNGDNDYRLHIYLLGDKCRILNNLPDFIFEVHNTYGVDFCEPEWSVDGKDLSAIKFDGDEDEYDEEIQHPADNMPIVPEPIKVENPKVVDTDTLAPQMDIKEDEEKPKYDNDFLEHIASIWEDKQRTILVDVSGMKFVINGLFDNQDVIIDVYVADTMQRIDRYIEIGATDGLLAEAEYYVEHFAKKIVKDLVVTESWYLTEKQFKFLKEA